MSPTFKIYVSKKILSVLSGFTLVILQGISCSSVSFAQDVNAYKFDPPSEFDYRVVYDVKEAPNGHIWFGTAHGLVHYDGQNIQKYSALGYDNEVTNISFEKDSSVWCVNFGGQIFKTSGDSLVPALRQSYNGHIIKQFKLLDNGNILYVTQNDLRIMTYNPVLKKHTIFYELPVGYYIHDIKFDQNPIPVAHSFDGLLQISFISRNGELIEKSPLCQERLNTGSTRLHIGDDGKYYASAVHGVLSLVDMSTGNVVYLDDSTNAVECNNIIWLDERLMILKKNSICIANLKKGTGYTDVLLQNTSASQVMRDREGNTWVSSIDDGVFIVPNMTVKHHKLVNNKLVSAVSDTADNLYLYTNKGEFFKSEWPYTVPRLISTENFRAHSLYYNPYRHLVQLGSADRYYNIESGTIQFRRTSNQAYKQIHAINESVEVATFSQKAVLYAKKQLSSSAIRWGRVEDMNYPNDIKLREKRSLDIASDGKGNVYIDYIDGLMHYSTDTLPKFLEYKGARLIVGTMASNNRIGVWAITLGNELLHIEDGEVAYRHRLSQRVNRVFCKGDLVYLASNQGVLIFNPANQEYRLYDEKDGLFEDKVLDVLFRDSVLFIQGERYLQRIPLYLQNEYSLPPIVTINNFRVHGKEMDFKGGLNLSFNENDILIDFAVLSTRSRGAYKVSYRLAATQDWSDLPSNSSSVSLPQLAPGSYTFELKACNVSGACSIPQSVSFTVAAPFYRVWWFYALVFGGVLISVILLYQYRLRQKQTQIKWVREQEKLKGALYKSQTKAIQSQMNPHFLFNALNSVQDLVLMEDIEGSNKYLGKFSDLLRKILKSSRVTTISLYDEMEILELYLSLEKLRFGKEFSYELKTNISRESAEKLMLPAMIIQPFAENAIKHGLFHKKGDKHLRIEFSIDEEQLVCEIEDNGIGRQRSREITKKQTKLHGGFSTRAVKERIELMERTLQKEIYFETVDFDSKNNSGTKVILKFPKDLPDYGS